MFNQKDLYAALQNGENPEKIAQQFADALNGAIAQKKKEEAEAEAAKKAAAAKVQARIDAINDILDAVDEFIAEFYPDMHDPQMRADIDAVEVDKIILQAYNETVAMMGTLKEIISMKKKIDAQNKPVAEKPVLKTATTVTPKDADAALKAFLTRNGF
jgi:predicted Zn-dependent peptidase